MSKVACPGISDILRDLEFESRPCDNAFPKVGAAAMGNAAAPASEAKNRRFIGRITRKSTKSISEIRSRVTLERIGEAILRKEAKKTTESDL